MNYRLSKKAITLILYHSSLIGILVAANKKNDTETIRRWLRANKINGPLTTRSNIMLLTSETGLSEKTILESVTPYPTLSRIRKIK